MEWYNKLYVSEGASKRKRSIKRNIRMNRFQPGVYVITLPMNPENILDIFPAAVLKQNYYKKADMMAVGLATTIDEAKSLAVDILMDCYNNTGHFNIANFIKDRK